LEVIHDAVEVLKKTGRIRRSLEQIEDDAESHKNKFNETYKQQKILCPLNKKSTCSLYEYRPIRCRIYHAPGNSIDLEAINGILFARSQNVFFAFSGLFLEKDTLSFSLAETVSGKFVQEYFHYLAYLATASSA
jgi:Fe-S-cluster containining protein